MNDRQRGCYQRHCCCPLLVTDVVVDVVVSHLVVGVIDIVTDVVVIINFSYVVVGGVVSNAVVGVLVSYLVVGVLITDVVGGIVIKDSISLISSAERRQNHASLRIR